MTRWLKGLLGAAAGAAVLAAGAYQFRTDLALALVRWQTAQEVAPNRPVPWQQGPQQAALAPAERPPNIVFILFDDLGIDRKSVV